MIEIGKASLRGSAHVDNEDAAAGQAFGEGAWVFLVDGMSVHGLGDVAAAFASFTGGKVLFHEPSPGNALIQAHHSVCALAHLGSEGRRPGCAALAAVIRAGELKAARVGDVRAYLWTPLGGLELLFGEDHYNGIGLTRWLGQPGELEPEVVEQEIPERCVLLFLTDGVWDPLGENLLNYSAALGGGAQEVANRLVCWAHQIDDYDDATAVVIVRREE